MDKDPKMLVRADVICPEDPIDREKFQKALQYLIEKYEENENMTFEASEIFSDAALNSVGLSIEWRRPLIDARRKIYNFAVASISTSSGNA